MIGERFDADAGLQYLNARYYDPKLAMFIQPDWWEVMQAGVGVNRYGYSFNDPVNGMDPGGNICIPCGIVAVIAYLASTDPANAPGANDSTLPPSGDRGMVDSVIPAASIASAVSEGDYLGAAMEALPGPNIGKSLKNGKKLIGRSAGDGFDDLAEMRTELGLPAAGSAVDKSTIAMVEVNGTKVYGINAHGQPVTGVNAISATHAEIDALNQIRQKGLDVRGQNLTLYVDRTPCASCSTNGGIRLRTH